MRSKIYTNVYKPKSREFIIDRELRFQTSKNSSKIRRAKLVDSARKFLGYGAQKFTTLASKYSTVVYKGICKMHSRGHFSSQSGNFSKKKNEQFFAVSFNNNGVTVQRTIAMLCHSNNARFTVACNSIFSTLVIG